MVVTEDESGTDGKVFFIIGMLNEGIVKESDNEAPTRSESNDRLVDDKSANGTDGTSDLEMSGTDVKPEALVIPAVLKVHLEVEVAAALAESDVVDPEFVALTEVVDPELVALGDPPNFTEARVK